MRVENLLMSANASSILTYKPDIFSALGFLHLYSSHVMLMMGRSRVETVGTILYHRVNDMLVITTRLFKHI
jgi:uncharacterized membrane protein